MGRVIVFVYGVISYVIFLVAFLYAIGFVGNALVPKSIDGPMTQSMGMAILINALLLSAFAIQHTIMARQGFKRVWTKIISPAAERSTFVLVTSLILLLMFWKWASIDGTIWSVENPVWTAILQALSLMGWVTVLISTFLVDHFDLFGLKQVTYHLMKKNYDGPVFKEWSFYRFVRHPIYLGFIVAFWATPTMSAGHLMFSLMTTGYILMGIAFEERDLLNTFGNTYAQYRKRIPMLIPFTKTRKPGKVTPLPGSAGTSSK